MIPKGSCDTEDTEECDTEVQPCHHRQKSQFDCIFTSNKCNPINAALVSISDSFFKNNLTDHKLLNGSINRTIQPRQRVLEVSE